MRVGMERELEVLDKAELRPAAMSALPLGEIWGSLMGERVIERLSILINTVADRYWKCSFVAS